MGSFGLRRESDLKRLLSVIKDLYEDVEIRQRTYNEYLYAGPLSEDRFLVSVVQPESSREVFLEVDKDISQLLARLDSARLILEQTIASRKKGSRCTNVNTKEGAQWRLRL